MTLFNFWKFNVVGVHSPLEQFEIIALHHIMPMASNKMVASSFLILVLFYNLLVSSKKLSGYLTKLFTALKNVGSDVYKNNVFSYRKELKNIILTLFLIIFFSNITGMIPFAFTTTSAFWYTFYLSLIFFVYTNIFIILKQRWHSFNFFLPAKEIFWIAPSLVLIEIISYFSKIFSLSLRLFANMVAGHMLLKIILIFYIDLFNSGVASYIFANVMIFLILNILILLELFLAFLQAYVFALLISLYCKDVAHAH